jgi:predicted HicB family RNase H-like nuclease
MKNKVIHIQVETNLKNELQEEAKQKGLSLNAYIRMLLIEREK